MTPNGNDLIISWNRPRTSDAWGRLWYSNAMNEGPEKNNVIQFKSQEELKKEARIKMTLANALEAIDTAYEGRGAVLAQLTDTDKESLARTRDRVNEVVEAVLANPHDALIDEMVTNVMQGTKVELAKYLSEAQYVELFGSGSLA